MPLFFLLLPKEESSISSNTTSNTTRVKTGIKQHAKVEYCGAHRGYTHDISLNRCKDNVYPLFFLLLLKEMSSILSNTGIKQLERWNIVVLVGGIYVYPLAIFLLFQLSLAE